MTHPTFRAFGRGAAASSDASRVVLERGFDPSMPWALHRDWSGQVLAEVRRIMAGGDVTVAASEVAAAVRGQQTRTAGAVAVLPLRGVITPRSSFMSFLFGGGGGLEAFRETFSALVADDDIAAIVLDIDSPGGSVSLVHETAQVIFEARGSKPIVAVADTMAASAAYWLASQADEVVVTPSGQVGSVGTYLMHEDWSKFNADLGVTTTYVFAGEHKTDGNPDEPLSDAARADMQQTVDDYQALFVADVAAGRGVPAATVEADFGQGRVFPAQRAVDAGLADRVASLEDVVGELVAAPAAPQALRAAAAPSEMRALLGLDAGTPDAEVLDRLRALPTTDPTPPGDGDGPASSPPPAPREAAASAVPPWLLIPTPRRH